MITDEAGPVAAELGERFRVSADDVLAHPHVLVGTVDAICDELGRRREEYGITYVSVPLRALREFAPVVARLAGH
jgi:hypothetical protein